MKRAEKAFYKSSSEMLFFQQYHFVIGSRVRNSHRIKAEDFVSFHKLTNFHLKKLRFTQTGIFRFSA